VSQTLTYRREIDGLRALAVLPVILFHAGFSAFRGGYVGVDVFFVISGYLITGIILADRAAGRFSLTAFYERRARRILPALFFVMAACIPFAFLWMLPGDRNDFFQSLVAVAGFASNFLFWSESDYFATAVEWKPLLHTWSLAVEEQFYVLFPLLLILLWRIGRRHLFGLLAVAALLSLGLAQWTALHHPDAAFYLLPMRAWELLIGALISLHRLNHAPRPASAPRAQFAGMLGLALLAYAVVAFDKTTPYPSVYTLAPTLGTALLILYATPQTWAGRFLGYPALVGIGLISYSAYLWHQPLFAFVRLRSLDAPGGATFAALSAAALVLAYFTWRFVETPFRDRKRMGRRTIFSFAAAGSLAFLAIGGLGDHTDGFEKSYIANLTPAQKLIYAFEDYNYKPVYRARECFLVKNQNASDFAPACAPETSPAPKTIVVWGDSHAASLASGLRAQRPGSLAQFTASACAPLVDFDSKSSPNCADINDYVLQQITRLHPSIVMLHANWREYEMLGMVATLDRTIARVREASPASDIVVLGGLPQWEPSLPLSLIRRDTSLTDGATIPTPLLADLRRIDVELAGDAAKSGARFVSVLDAVCGIDSCMAIVGSDQGIAPIAWDYGHLTEAGASALAERLIATITDPAM